MPTPTVRARNERGLRVSNLKSLASAGPAGGRRGIRGVRADAPAPTDPLQVLLAALADQELEATHEFEIAPTGAGGGGGRRGLVESTGDKSVDVEVDVGPLESAVVLVEQDGEFTWHFPEPVATPKAGLRRGLRKASAKAAAPTSVTIPVRLHARAARRSTSGRRGFGIGSILSAAKGIVLKFVARTAAGIVLHQLERNVRKGIVVLDDSDPQNWRRVETLDDLQLAEPANNEPLRILLWVHGTFSSTAGAFGALTSMEEGKALLSQAKAQYHAVIGYDHPTLSETPLENAVDLVERLGRFNRPMKLDVVTHSRGGLVYRSLVELLLPASVNHPQLGPAVFVGVPNGGTSLAEPDNWNALVDLYTNLAAGAFNLLQAVPGATVPAKIFAEIISGLGAFVKYLANVIVTERAVPGLAAQERNGEFVKALNAVGAGQPLPDDCRYLAVTSNFDPKAAVDGTKPTGLAASFLGRLANGFIDQLFGDENDLVVDDASMKQIDTDAGVFIDAALDFGNSATVYHTVYFGQPQVASQLRAWLLDDTARRGLAARAGLLTVQPSSRSPFTRVRYHEANAPSRRRAPSADAPAAAKGRRRGLAVTTPKVEPMSAEGISNAAATHLEGIFGKRHETRPSARAIVTRNYAPQLVKTTTQVSNFSKTRQVHIVCYHQTHREIPIFGTRAVVEVDDSGKLIAAQAKLANVTGVAPEPKLAPDKASAALASLLKLAPKVQKQVSKQEATLTFFHDRPADKWHLAYLFRDVPALPPKTNGATSSANAAHHGHRLGGDPRQRFPRLDYLLDANSGEIVYYYSVSPTAARKTPNPIPTRLKGLDDEGNAQLFFGLPTKNAFLLHDPTRFIRTHDLKGGNIDTAEVPAHVNSGFVFDFYNSVLIRRGVDDQGMEVVNVVNCTSPQDERPPQWGNAVWWNKKMWYGQMVDGTERRSLARYLDVIGHELTHGVTETTSNLVYREEAGALNESFSDIFGVIINNWTKRRGVDTRKWDWEIGSGLGDKPGNPLRNMKNPKVTGDPAHTKDMLTLKPGEQPSDDNDMGFVHTNSNIHNKAAFNVLTATVPGAKGKTPPLVFEVEDVARLYYFTLQRLDRVATFEDVYFTLLDVVRTMYPDPDEQKAKLAAITKAYGDVGIPRPRRAAAPSEQPKAASRKGKRPPKKGAKLRRSRV